MNHECFLFYFNFKRGIGGVQKRLGRLLKYISKYEDSKIIINSEYYSKLKILNLIGNERNYIIINESRNKIVLLFRYLIEVLKNYKVNKIYTTGELFILLPILKLFNIKSIFIIPTSKIKELPVKSRIIFALGSYFSNSVDMLNSLNDINLYINKRKINISPCSFSDPTIYYPEIKEKYIVFLGQLSDRKNPLSFLEISSEFKNYKEWKFLIIGKGKYKNYIKQKINKYYYRNVSLFYTEKPYEILNKSIIFCSLQKIDNYPSQSLIEAGLSGNIIIATDVGETKKMFPKNYKYLIKYPINNEEFANKIKAAIDLFVHNKKEFYKSINEIREHLINNNNIDIYIDYLRNL